MIRRGAHSAETLAVLSPIDVQILKRETANENLRLPTAHHTFAQAREKNIARRDRELNLLFSPNKRS